MLVNVCYVFFKKSNLFKLKAPQTQKPVFFYSLITNDIEHLCLLAICISSLKKYLLRSFAYFEIGFLLLFY